MLTALQENLSTILSNNTTIFSLIGMLIIIIAFTKIKQVKFSTSMITQIGVALGASIALSFIKPFTAPYGGSVTLGSMVPIIIISYIYGPIVGVLTGFLRGVLDLIIGPAQILHPIQILFDYALPFMAIGLSGFIKNNKLLGATFATSLRFVFHFISGFIFWGFYAPEGMSPLLYSFLYNISYVFFDGLICVLILAVLPIERLQKELKRA
ncbi:MULTISPECIES: energy-coupled thiamine transporter ThiT [Clostridium]|nr:MULTISPECIES: energy-coupled thiamine transporter ThiT [Clostridium]MDU1348633.1 energy-coupled thiamine transporter ThiT [Clostridium argentinense]